MAGQEPQSLKSLYARAEDRRLALDGAYDVTEPSYVDALTGAIADYTQCLRLVSQLSLFSPNESLEDLSTENIPYLIIDADIADLEQKRHTTTPKERIAVLERSRTHYEQYLDRLAEYDILDPEQAKLYAIYQESPTDFSIAPVGADAAARRNSKIANYQQEKALKSKIAYLRQHSLASIYPDDDLNDGPTPSATTRRAPNGIGQPDEESLRSLHLTILRYRAHTTFSSLESLNREMQLLSHAPTPFFPQSSSIADDERRRRSHEGLPETGDARLDRPLTTRLGSALYGPGKGGPILNREGKPLQPFTIVGNRQDIQGGVFKHGHNLPTMSIDEYLEEEKRRGGILEKGAGGEASGRRKEVDEDDMEEADRATYKARNWDEFTEANPRGSGNTLNRG